MIDPKSIHVLKHKNEDDVLEMLLDGMSVRAAAVSGGVSSKTAHNIRKKHADKFPQKDTVAKVQKLPRADVVKGPKSVMRSMRVPGDLDAAVCKEARSRSMEYQQLIYEILRGRYLAEVHLSFGNEKFDIPILKGSDSKHITKTIVDYLNTHGDFVASISEDGGVVYCGQNVCTISEGSDDK